MNEDFDCVTDERGIYQLGYNAAFSDGRVHVPVGEVVITENKVVVTSMDDAYDYLEAHERARNATVWNDMNHGELWSVERMQEVIRAVALWMATGPGEHKHRTLSHHGIRAGGSVVSCGTSVPLSAMPRSSRKPGLTITAYERDGFLDRYREKWIADDHDPQDVVDLVSEALGAKPIDTWNGGRSMVFDIAIHPDTFAAFAANMCEVCDEDISGPGMPTKEHTGTMPDGWKR